MPSADDFLDGKVLPTKSSADEFLDSTGPSSPKVASSGNPFTLPAVNPDRENKALMSQWSQTGVNPWQWSDKAKQAAQAGVDVNTGAGWGLRSRMDLANGPEETQRAIQGAGYQTRTGPETGQLEFMNPETGRWTTARSMNPNAPAGAPTAMEVGKTAAMTAASYLAPETAPVWGTIGGAATGAMAAETGRQIVSNVLGIKQSTSNPKDRIPFDPDILKSEVAEGATAGALATFGAGVAALPRVGSYLRYGPGLFSHPVFNTKYWPQIQEDMKAADQTLEDYYKLAGNKNLSLDVAQRSQHPAPSMAIEDAKNTLKDIAVDYAQRGKSNLSNLQQTFEDVTKGITGPGPIDPLASGPSVVQWAAEQKAAALAQKELEEKVATDAAKREIDGLPAMSKDEVNQRVTEQLRLIERADKAQVDKAYGDLAVKLGVPRQVAYDQNSDRFMQAQAQAASFELTPIGKLKLSNYIDEARRAGQVDTTITGGKLNAIPDGFLNKDGTVNTEPKDMYWVVQAIKGIRAGVRKDAVRQSGWIQPDAQDAARVAEILSNDVKYRLYSVGDGSALEALEAAEHQARIFGDKWRDSVLSEAAEKSNGFSQYPLSSAVNHALFKSGVDGDKTALTELAKIAKGDPEFEESIRQNIFAVYRSQYTRDGVPTPQLHAKFLEDMAGPIDAFFTPAERAQITHLKNLGDVVAKRSADVASFERAWKKSAFGQIPANSTMIAKAAFSNSAKVSGLAGFLRANNPGLLKEVQKDTAVQLAQRVLGTSGTQFNVRQLDTYLNGVQGKNLREIMPPEYINALRTISAIGRISTDTERVASPLEQPLIHRVIKVATGAFGKEARIYHLVRGFREKQAARALYNTLADPEKMSQFMALKDQYATSARGAAYLTSVGAYGLGQKDPQ